MLKVSEHISFIGVLAGRCRPGLTPLEGYQHLAQSNGAGRGFQIGAVSEEVMPYPISRSIFLIATGLIEEGYHHQSGELMRIAIVGSGYVGLVSGACLADFGHKVVCIDKAEAKIVDLQAGRMPIYEPGLEELVCKNSATGQLAFTSALAPAVADADVVFIAVGTPSRRGDGHADLSYIYEAAREMEVELAIGLREEGYAVWQA